MILLDDLLLQEQVLTAHFACDLHRCKGACCTMSGGAGAPLLESEIADLRSAVSAALPYLPERSRAWLAEHDPVVGAPDDTSVACLDDADCVFVYYEGAVAKCGIERAYHNGETAFRKPISCHLFPIRVAQFGGPYLHYEMIAECEPGRANGEARNMLLVESLREPLVRAFGKHAYARMLAYAHGEDGGDV